MNGRQKRQKRSTASRVTGKRTTSRNINPTSKVSKGQLENVFLKLRLSAPDRWSVLVPYDFFSNKGLGTGSPTSLLARKVRWLQMRGYVKEYDNVDFTRHGIQISGSVLTLPNADRFDRLLSIRPPDMTIPPNVSMFR